jgi:(p)ppGpp synthase/HD superfamily hydrolase
MTTNPSDRAMNGHIDYLTHWTRVARAVAIAAHAGQFRRDGKTPYHTHPEMVAESVRKELKPAAWLHDVLEDTPLTLAHLNWIGLPPHVIDTVLAITRGQDEAYDEYIERLLLSRNAVEIKIADMKHNLSCQPSENSKAKIAKWLPVLEASVKPSTLEEVQAIYAATKRTR